MKNLEADILTRLQNGESAENIAQGLINALNNANAKYEDEVTANSQKVKDLQAIFDSLKEFMFKYYCEDEADAASIEKSFEQFKATDLIDLVDSLEATFSSIPEIDIIFGKKPAPKKKSADTVINDFLTSMGLK